MEKAGILLNLPNGIDRAIHMTPDELERHIRLMAALKMFELGKISAGRAAELAGFSRLEFLETCGRYRVSIFNYPAEELEAELRRDLDALQDMTDDHSR